MSAYVVGQRVQSRQGGGELVVAMTLGDAALATTDGDMLGGPDWCLHRDRQVGHFEYFGGSNEGIHGMLDLRCRRPIDQWGPPDRVSRRPAGLGFEY